MPSLAASRILLSAAALSLGATVASAATLSFSVTGDANIRPNTANTNGSQLVLVGDTTTANDYLRGLFSFTLDNPALVGATIHSVSLRLFVETADGTSADRNEVIQVFQLSRAFNETQVTWTNATTTTPWTTPGGDFSTTLLSSVTANPRTVTANQSLTFDSSSAFVTSVINTLQQPDKTLSLLLKLETENNQRSIFRFYAGTTTNPNLAAAALRPQLLIDYTAAPIPEPSAFAALAGLGALGFASLRRRRR